MPDAFNSQTPPNAQSKYEMFFQLCNDLCNRRVKGALAKRHGSTERVEHVTSVSELHRLISKEIEEKYTEREID
jgi:hypothetical protein